MDPSACSACGRWVRRCTCGGDAKQLLNTSGVVADWRVEGGLLASLPDDLLHCVLLRCSLDSLGAIARTSKASRLQIYCDELWLSLRETAPWATTCAAASRDGEWDRERFASARLALRYEREVEKRWRARRWAAAPLPLQRCSAGERIVEAASASLTDDSEWIVVTGERPPMLQVWRAKPPHVLTHSLRGRAQDRFNARLLPPARDASTQFWRALSTDRRKSKGALYLWNVLPKSGRGPDGSALRRIGRSDPSGDDAVVGSKPRVLSGHRTRLTGAALDGKCMRLATSDEQGRLCLWHIADEVPRCVGSALLGVSLESIAMCEAGVARRLIACGGKDGKIALLSIDSSAAAEQAAAEQAAAKETAAKEAVAAAAMEAADAAAAADAADAADAAEVSAEAILAALKPEPALPELSIIEKVLLEGHTDWVTHLELHCSGAAEANTGAEVGADESASRGTGKGEGKLSTAKAVAGRSTNGRRLTRHHVGQECRVLLSGSRDHTVRVWGLHAATAHGCAVATPLHVLSGHSRWINRMTLGFHRCTPGGERSSMEAPRGIYSREGRLSRIEESTTCANGRCFFGNAPSIDGGFFVVSASADSLLQVWRLRDGALLGTLRGHRLQVTDFELHGTRLVSTSLDGTIRAWELGPLLAAAPHAPAPAALEVSPISEHVSDEGPVRNVAFDFERIVSVDDEGKVSVIGFWSDADDTDPSAD